MNRTATFAALTLALALPATSALAQDVYGSTGAPGISWSYFDIGVNHLAPDASALDSSTGLAIRGSGMINANWHIFLGWSRNKLEGSYAVGPVGVVADDDLDRFNIGLGYNIAIGQRSDLFARVGYERIGSGNFVVTNPDGNFGGKIESNDGYSVEVGVRSEFSRSFEGGASVRYIAFDDPDVTLAGQRYDATGLVSDDSHAALVLNGQYKFGNGWGLVGEAEVGSAYNNFFLGARLSY